jgi:hypothetical protein
MNSAERYSEADSRQLAAGRRQRTEVRGRRSEVGRPNFGLRIANLQMFDDLYEFNEFNDLNGLGHRDGILPHILASIEGIICHL